VAKNKQKTNMSVDSNYVPFVLLLFCHWITEPAGFFALYLRSTADKTKICNASTLFVAKI